MDWAVLVLSGLMEAVWATALDRSDGFSNAIPTIVFLVGMLFCGGRLGFWEPTAFVGIFCLYCFGISPSITPFFGICGRKGAKLLKKHVKKVK